LQKPKFLYFNLIVYFEIGSIVEWYKPVIVKDILRQGLNKDFPFQNVVSSFCYFHLFIEIYIIFGLTFVAFYCSVKRTFNVFTIQGQEMFLIGKMQFSEQ